MAKVWTQADIHRHISDSIPESLNLDYKAAGSLAKTDEKRREVTKDVSAMANSDGGIIIYGVSEDKTVTPSVPSHISPVDAAVISKEWLEQVINTIRPRIDGVIIHAVQLSTGPSEVLYVVEIPQSTTAHQATDKRYYKRFNFLSTAMEDYEIRDVMSRSQHAQIDLEFHINITYERETLGLGYIPTDMFGRSTKPMPKTRYDLQVIMANSGNIYAQYIKGYLELPLILLFDEVELAEYKGVTQDFERYGTFECDNTKRDVTKYELGQPREFGPVRYVPILAKTSLDTDKFQLREDFQAIDWQDRVIQWTVHADNAAPRSGETAIQEIKVIDERET